MIIYENDIEIVCSQVAWVSTRAFIRRYPELEDMERLEEVRALYRRAFLPRAYAKFAKKCAARGHELVRGIGPVRPSVARRRDRFITGLVYTIEQASKRFDDAEQSNVEA